MGKADNIDKFTLRRVSAFKDELLLLTFCILLFFELDNYIRVSKVNNPSMISYLTNYSVLFIALACLYFPKKINNTQISIFFVTAFVFRLFTLFTLPVLTHDLHRDLLFGSVLADGWNPYLWTVQNIPILMKKGLILKVSYITDWASHSFDYPSLAVIFFGIVSWLVPADNFSAYVVAKLVLMIVDLLNAYLIYLILSVHFNLVEAGKKTALLYLLNPLSMIWVNLEGQFESIPIFLVLLSFYLLFYYPSGNHNNYENKINLSLKKFYIKLEYYPYLIGFLIACGFLFKFFPIVFIIPIIFYFGKNLKAIFNFLFALFLSISILSIPFIVNSYYITNFFSYQIERQGNSLTTASFNIGISIPIPIIDIIVIIMGCLFYYSLRKRFDKKLQTTILGTFSIYIFIYLNNSYHPWYFLWVFGTLLFINTSHDEFYGSLLWILVTIIFISIWSPTYILIVILLIPFSYFLTLEKVHSFIWIFHFKRQNEILE